MGYREVILGDRPVRYWRLGETSGSTAVDETGHENGTYTATPGLLGVAGLLTNDANKAWNPNAVGGITAPTNPLPTPTDFSAEFWFNRPANNSAAQFFSLNAGNPTFAQTFLFNLGGYSGGGVNKLAFGYGQSGVVAFSATFGPVITLGHTYHIVGTYKVATQTWTLYVDGALFAQRSTPGAPAPFGVAGMVPMVGFNYNGGAPSSWFDGPIDEPAIYNYALGASVVAKHYNAGKAKFQTNGFLGLMR